MRRSPHLLVPIRDRRQRRRIVTLKNLGRFAIAVAILFLGLTLQSELRRPRTDSYGRLFGKQVSGQPAIARKTDVIRETPVEDQTSADPLLIAPAVREQYLGVNGNGGLARQSIEPAGEPAPHVDGPVITGPNGVTIVRGGTPRPPLLSGGIFRQ